jgi:hypothetical protein
VPPAGVVDPQPGGHERVPAGARIDTWHLPADGPMPGGTANRGLVHRIGNTVRRPVAPCRVGLPE